ncbi:MAG: hypothetical protein M3R55_17175, partial [Acidobacteriota bacterium]|nr:hypothetical protein [Acidobacteriota bacterium]
MAFPLPLVWSAWIARPEVSSGSIRSLSKERTVMSRQPLAAADRDRIARSLPFVESLARRVASTMPNSIDIGDLVQDGMLGLIDA